MKQILIAGFGGQGILFTGKFLAYAGMMQGMEVSWLPSYGPEMRGGTANCSVIISKGQIGSPLILTPDILICMNLPSLDKFENTVSKQGKLFIDNSLISRKSTLEDVEAHYVPATKMAFENNLEGLANMIMLGKVIKETSVCDMAVIPEAMKKIVPERKKDLFNFNLKAIDLGYNYKEE